jgi:hypothetical protein
VLTIRPPSAVVPIGRSARDARMARLWYGEVDARRGTDGMACQSRTNHTHDMTCFLRTCAQALAQQRFDSARRRVLLQFATVNRSLDAVAGCVN